MSNQEKENYLRDLELLCSRIKKQKHDDDIRETIRKIGEENMKSLAKHRGVPYE